MRNNIIYWWLQNNIFTQVLKIVRPCQYQKQFNYSVSGAEFITWLHISIIMVPNNSASYNITNKWNVSYKKIIMC